MYRKGLVTGHIVVWLTALAFLLIPMFKFGILQPIPYAVTAFLLYLSTFYLHLFWIFPRWAKKRRPVHLLLSWLALMIVYTFLFLIVNARFDVYQNEPPWPTLLHTFLRCAAFTGCFLVVSTAYQFTVDWFRNERQREKLENQQLKTKLAFLRSQINPHFLFNTLNNIYTLAYQQSAQTADAVMRLSGMMQYMLYESNAEHVLLRKELDYVEQFIALQQLRMKENLPRHIPIMPCRVLSWK